MARTRGLASFSANFEPQISASIDARLIVPTKAELIDPTTWTANDGNRYLFNGMAVSVFADGANNGVYLLIDSANYTLEASWLKIGAGGGGIQSLTTAQRIALGPTAAEGTTVWDSELDILCVWDGTSWIQI